MIQNIITLKNFINSNSSFEVIFKKSKYFWKDIKNLSMVLEKANITCNLVQKNEIGISEMLFHWEFLISKMTEIKENKYAVELKKTLNSRKSILTNSDLIQTIMFLDVRFPRDLIYHKN